MDVEVMLRQVRALGDDVRRSVPDLDERVAALLARPKLRDATTLRAVGCGDSLNAAIAARMAFGAEPGSDYAAVSGFEYSAYMDVEPVPASEMVLAVSASGGTPTVLDALRAAAARRAVTLAIVGREGSVISAAAQYSLAVSLPDGEPSPGIRTFTASLLALLVFAGHRAASRSADGPRAIAGGVTALRSEPAEVAAAIDATNAQLDQCAAPVLDAIANAPAIVIAGSGPSYGTARHAAAKLVEGAGVLAVAQDLEEWRHIERFAAPADLPLIVIAPPGRSARHAADVAGFAASLGRRVIVVAPEDSPIARDRHPLLPVIGAVPEELSPLVYQLFAPHLAFHWARRLGRRPFHEGEPGYRLAQ